MTELTAEKEVWRDKTISEWSGKPFELDYDKMMSLFHLASEGRKPWYKTLDDEREKEGAEKYGYIFVDTTGTTCDTYHPNAAGHRHIADRILDALPDANFPFADVASDSEYYDAIEFMYRKGYMAGTSETQFSPDSALTKSALVQALYGMAGSPEVNTENISFADLDSSNPAFKAAVWAVGNGIVKASDGKFEPDSEVSIADFGLTMIRFSAKVDFNLKRVVKTVSMSFNLALENKFMIIKRSITRAQAAQKLAGYRYY